MRPGWRGKVSGTIEIRKPNLLGYTPETQVYYIQNAGGKGSVEVSKFLQSHRKFFDLSLFCGQTYYSLPSNRIEKFRQYAATKGFGVKDSGYVG